MPKISLADVQFGDGSSAGFVANQVHGRGRGRERDNACRDGGTL